jgi:hypothetical protein
MRVVLIIPFKCNLRSDYGSAKSWEGWEGPVN